MPKMLGKIVVGNFIICAASQMLIQAIKSNMMGRASSTYGRDEKCMQNCGLKT